VQVKTPTLKEVLPENKTTNLPFRGASSEGLADVTNWFFMIARYLYYHVQLAGHDKKNFPLWARV
jgi:hypothetical protein